MELTPARHRVVCRFTPQACGEGRRVHVAKKIAMGVLVVVGVVFFFSGGPFYTVDADEEALVLTFGRHTGTTGPGFHVKAPWPIQSTIVLPVMKVRRMEVGFRTVDPGPPAVYRDFKNDSEMLREASMLTGDENIVICDLTVQWKIADSVAYAFSVRDPEETLFHVMESVTRQVVGDHGIDIVLTSGKDLIQQRIKVLAQRLVSEWHMGIDIQSVLLGEVQPPPPVAASFKAVAAAKEDKEKYINESLGYRNQEIPKARGAAAQVLAEAEGYAAERIAKAEGDARRFSAIGTEHKKDPALVEKRLYLEAMQPILSRAHKTIVDDKVTVVNLDGVSALAGVKGGGQ
jgi:membrane protease subunit HflK